METPLLFPITALAVALAATPSGRAAVVTLNAAADSFVTTGPSNNLSTRHYGGAGALAVAAAGRPRGEFQSVLRFNTSTARSTFDSQYGPGAWHVQSVTLRLTAIAPNHAIFNANTAGSFAISWMQNDSWTEGAGIPNAPGTSGINYTTLQSTFINAGADEVLGTFNYNGANSGAVSYTLNTPPGFTADLLAGNAISLRFSAVDTTVSYLFNSRTFITAANRPVLTITAIPEPASMALLASGGLLLRARRRAIV